MTSGFDIEVTDLLRRVAAGDAQASDDLFTLLDEELRRIAKRHAARCRADETISPTDLVHAPPATRRSRKRGTTTSACAPPGRW